MGRFSRAVGMAAVGLGVAGPALARSRASDPAFTLIPPGDRLSLIGVFEGAMPVLQLVFAGLGLAVIAALATWLIQLALFSRGRRDSAAGAIAYLAGQVAAAPLFGLSGAIYGLVAICIGITNKRPGPTLMALAPGLAEALLSLGLGILAAAVATVALHHLKARLQVAAKA
jgi:hypothetical protein